MKKLLLCGLTALALLGPGSQGLAALPQLPHIPPEVLHPQFPLPVPPRETGLGPQGELPTLERSRIVGVVEPDLSFAKLSEDWQELAASPLGSLSWNKKVQQYWQYGQPAPVKLSVIVKETFKDEASRQQALQYDGCAYANTGLEYLTRLSFFPAERSMVVEERSDGTTVTKVDKKVELHPLHRYLAVFASVLDDLCGQGELEQLKDLGRYSFLYFRQEGEGRVPVYADTQTMYFAKDNELVYWELAGNMAMDLSRVRLTKKLLLLDTLQEVTITERSWQEGCCDDPRLTPGELLPEGKYKGEAVSVAPGSEEERGLAQLRQLAKEQKKKVDRYGRPTEKISF